VVVPLDRTGAVPGRVGLSVRTIQLRKKTRKTRKEAVLFLAGGPGQAATTLASDVAEIVAPFLRTRDFVAVDTRGTGRSTDLIVCPELETAAATGLSAPESFASCARRIGPAIDLYGTTDVVADLEAVRVAGGYDRLYLVGVSYGTYTAQRYAAAHPDRVSGMILDSTVDPTADDPYSLGTFRAMPRALENGCDRRACAGVTTDVAGDLARTRARLPVTAAVDDGRGRRRGRGSGGSRRGRRSRGVLVLVLAGHCGRRREQPGEHGAERQRVLYLRHVEPPHTAGPGRGPISGAPQWYQEIATKARKRSDT
jgi:pimeloyl-ACP methyl ester carboxylesterase